MRQGRPPRHTRIFLFLGALSALCAVVLGAVLAHLPMNGQAVSAVSMQTAVNLHQFHALGLLVTGLSLSGAERPSRWTIASGWLMVAGTLLFSVNLYLRGMAGIETFRVLVPWGGAAFIAGWLSLAVGMLRQTNARLDPPR